MNPFQMMGAMQNPMRASQDQMMSQMRAQNPQLFQKVQEMTAGKSDDELKAIATNIAKERGIDLRQFAGQFGIRL